MSKTLKTGFLMIMALGYWKDNLTPISASILVSSAIPPGQSLTLTANLTSRPSIYIYMIMALRYWKELPNSHISQHLGEFCYTTRPVTDSNSKPHQSSIHIYIYDNGTKILKLPDSHISQHLGEFCYTTRPVTDSNGKPHQSSINS